MTQANGAHPDSAAQEEDKASKIARINEWVRSYKEDGVRESRDSLLLQFKPFLVKQSQKFGEIYSGVHPSDQVLQEARIIFCDLLDEYTIGGPAYFNVFIQRKLPFRLRYFFVREIRRRGKYLSHSDEQLAMLDGDMIPCVDDHAEMVAVGLDNASDLAEILAAIYDGETLTDRERDIVIRRFFGNQNHEVIAAAYSISRSRVSRIIKLSLQKVRERLCK